MTTISWFATPRERGRSRKGGDMADTVNPSNAAFHQAGPDDDGMQMLTQDEVELIATARNDAADLPILNEAREPLVLSKLVMRIDRFLCRSFRTRSANSCGTLPTESSPTMCQASRTISSAWLSSA